MNACSDRVRRTPVWSACLSLRLPRDHDGYEVSTGLSERLLNLNIFVGDFSSDHDGYKD